MALLAALTVALPARAQPEAVDLRPEFAALELSPRNQGRRPTCSVHTLVGALEFAAARSRNGGRRLSVEYANWAANQVRDKVRDGGFFSELWDGFARHGCCTEQLMPYRRSFQPDLAPDGDARRNAADTLGLGLRMHWIKKWDVTTGLSDGQFRAIMDALSDGWPVCAGLRWPKRSRWRDDILQMCPADRVFDGHSVLLVGCRDDPGQAGGGLFLIRDSDVGRDRAMPYAFARSFMNDALWIEAPEAGARAAGPCQRP